MRYGEMTAFGERPHSPYYGNADATPLYVVLLDEYERWTGDTKLVRELEYEARAALHWIDEYANLRGDGYIWYQRRNEKTGLENQCWKDSWDSISITRRHDSGLSTRDLRAPRLRIRRQDARGAPRPHGVERRRVRRRLGEAGRRPEAPLQPRLLGRQRRILRARARRERQPGRRARLEQRPPALERHRRQDESEGRRSAPDGTADVLGLGSAHPRRLAKAATTRSAITSAPSGRSTTRSSRGDYAATASRRKPPRSRRESSMPPHSSTVDSQKPSADTRATQPSTRCSTRPRAAHKRGPPERHYYSCAPCSASNRQATSSSSTRCSPKASVRSSYSTFPGAGAASTPSPANADCRAPSSARPSMSFGPDPDDAFEFISDLTSWRMYA